MFTGIPTRSESRRSGLGTSILLHAGLALTLMTARFPAGMVSPVHQRLVVIVPQNLKKQPAVRPEPRRIPIATPTRRFAPPLANRASLTAPAILPEFDLPRVAERTEPIPLPATPQPPPERPPVRTGNFGQAAVAPTAPAPPSARPVSPSGFGAVPAKQTAEIVAKAVLPSGFADSAVAQTAPARRGNVAASGFGAVSGDRTDSKPAAGLSQRPGVGGFGDAQVAAAPPGRLAGRVESVSFGDARVAAPATPRPANEPAGQASKPLQVLDKPHPVYTEEARRLGLEGEIAVEALFAASGETRVLRLLSSLGHGLDERAIEAVRGMRFRPAERDGHPVDSTAVVRVRFQLAY